MFEMLMVNHCSPTLAGIKTGNLFSYYFDCLNQLKNQISDVNYILNSKGVHVRLLRNTHNRALIYLYRPNELLKDLSECDVKDLLCKSGYSICNIESCIERLSDRLGERTEFPHEIGLFLGYPLKDVKGFIENNGRNFKHVGYWKVYGDEHQAKRTFARYKKCTNIYCKKLSQGSSILRLTVAT